MSKLTNYFKETKAELNHVNWPTRSETISFTLVVVLLSGLIAYFLGFFDYVFARIISSLIG